MTRTHGIGGLGIVSLADDCSLDRSVAVKQLRPERVLDATAVDRFLREARISRGNCSTRTSFPSTNWGFGPTIKFLSTPCGSWATARCTRRFRNTTPIPPPPASQRNLRFRGLLQSFLAVCNAVAYAHDRGVIHRDLKPANIMIGDFGEVILLDWGLAKRLNEAESAGLIQEPAGDKAAGETQQGARLGSPAYMAPEQAAGRIDLHGTHTDIYGLGVALYEILTGDIPFTGASTEDLYEAIQSRDIPDPRARNRAVPRSLSAVCRKAMEKQPADRYATAKALADDIQHWLADEPVSVYSEPLLARGQRLARKNPGPFAALAATILVGVVGLSVGLWLVNGEKNQKEIALVQKQAALKEAETERNKAVESSRLAAQRFEEKRTALDVMLRTFSDDRLKSEPGSQPIRKRFLEEGIQQYQRILADRAGDVPVMLQTANAYRELGVVMSELDEDTASLETLAKAVKVCRQAVAAEDSPQTRAALGERALRVGASVLLPQPPLRNKSVR